MPRAPRIQDAGHLHHVISRGNDRQALFRSPDDFRQYIDLLSEFRKQYPVCIYNFCLMDNHVHLLIEPLAEGNLSKFMENVSKQYAKYFNKKYNHVGHVFQGRFKSFLIQREKYLIACSRYCDLNPVKAKMVIDPKDYPWSGYKTLAYGKEGALKLDSQELFKNLGNRPEERHIAYRTLVFNYQGEELNLFDRRVCVLGDPDFKDKIKTANA